MRKLLHLFGICIMLLLLSSCSNSVKNDTNTLDKPVPDFVPLTDVVEGRKDIYLITKELDSNYWDIVEEGAKEAGEEIGCNIYHSGTYSEMQWKKQEELLDRCVELGADAILISPDDSVKLASKIEEIYEKGIPIILIDTAANTDSFNVCYMTDNLEAGNKAAEEMLFQLKAKGISEDEDIKVAVLIGNSKSQTINERLAGFYQYWTDNAPEKWTILSEIKESNGDVELGGQYVEEILNNNPDIKGLFATNNSPTISVSQKILDRNDTDITVVGFDYSDNINSLIESDDYQASTIIQRQFYMSYNGVKAAVDIINGASVNVKFEDTGVITVNSDNYKDPDVRAIIEGRK
ncbi:MAG: substrate-binding domain-containing protein [Lachnospiraceae bacterium]|nr:substrate-binding domain-containing protein [Lachnospiraceae bacterium]